jgi:predicted DNA binding CopG/RHH family protein
MNVSIKNILIILFGLLLISSCGKKAEDETTTAIVANNEAEVSITSNEADTTDKVYEEEYAKIFPKDDPKSPARKLSYEKGSVVTKNWNNEDFAECFVSILKADEIYKKSPEKYADEIENSRLQQQLMDYVFEIKIINKEITRQQFLSDVRNINSQISEGALAKSDKDGIWFDRCIKKSLEVSGAMNNN